MRAQMSLTICPAFMMSGRCFALLLQQARDRAAGRRRRRSGPRRRRARRTPSWPCLPISSAATVVALRSDLERGQRLGAERNSSDWIGVHLAQQVGAEAMLHPCLLRAIAERLDADG